MLVKRLVLRGRLPGLNELVDAKATRYKGGRSAYTVLKKKWQGLVMLLARSQGFECFDGGHFTYIFHEPARTRDPSNIIAGGVKLIEDALQDAGLLERDGWKHVFGIRARWVHDRQFTGVVVIVTNEAPTEKDIDQWAKELPTTSASQPQSFAS